jgi:hypothetical protein
MQNVELDISIAWAAIPPATIQEICHSVSGTVMVLVVLKISDFKATNLLTYLLTC